jgi:hypothetical protein
MRYLRPFFVLLMFGTQGCISPATLGAHSILPTQAVDTKEAWIYLQSEDRNLTGVYRCYDAQQNPVCIKAKLGVTR